MAATRVVSVITQAGEGGIEVVSRINYKSDIVPLNASPKKGILSTQFGVLLQLKKVASILRHCDLVVTNLPIHHIAFWLVNKFYGRKHIAVEHGPWAIVIGHKASIAASFLYQLWLRYSRTLMVTVSKDLYAFYNLIRSNNRYIPNRVELPSKVRLTPEVGGLKVVYVGRFDHQKDVSLAIDSFLECRKHNPAATLDLYGSGRELDLLRSRTSAHDGITFHGYVPDARDRLHEYDVCLLTSRFEGLPGTALEAMYAGCKVVTAPFMTGLLELNRFPNVLVAEDRRPDSLGKCLLATTAVHFNADEVRVALLAGYGDSVTSRYEELIAATLAGGQYDA